MSQKCIFAPCALDLKNIQGDILKGLPKKTQTYFFFQITDAESFRTRLIKLVPLITTTSQAIANRKAIGDHKKKGDKALIPMVGANIAFSHKGFIQMGVDDSALTPDANFAAGQRKDAESLGDKGTGTGDSFVPDWEPAFQQDIHGVILISGDSHAAVNKLVKDVEQIFGVGTAQVSIKEVTRIVGDVRPGTQSAHEHFGFLDGISNPSIIGFDEDPNPGPKQVPAGVIVTGHEGDPIEDRGAWTDGSFLVFRYLFQKVPEFDDFLKKHPVPFPGLTLEERSELLGARLVGRWKSGAPIDLAPFKDDPKLAADPKSNNDFCYAAERNFQKICPFAAHVRKTFPRTGDSIQKNRITRRGIQFGPEMTKQEKDTGKTSHGRGLLFVCYQSSIKNGFAFTQKRWANNPNFPSDKEAPEVPGLDPLIGQGDRKMTGTNPNDPAAELHMPDFVVPRGGEYFFSPSLKILKDILVNEAQGATLATAA